MSLTNSMIILKEDDFVLKYKNLFYIFNKDYERTKLKRQQLKYIKKG